MRINKILLSAVVVAALYSCGAPKDISYFQDIPTETIIQIAEQQQIRLKPADKISIVVNSKDPELTALFNLPSVTRYIGATTNYNQNQYVSLYTVSPDGFIDFPVVGKIHVEGMTRAEVAVAVKEKLISTDLMKDPTVTVEFQNLMVSVLGEVRTPGRYAIDRDRYTVLDALSQAGDLTIQGKRRNVTVLRTINNEQQIYKLDLCSVESVTNSPAYYLQQGDYVYVEPNSKRMRESTVNGNNILSTSFWISLASLATSIAVLIFK